MCSGAGEVRNGVEIRFLRETTGHQLPLVSLADTLDYHSPCTGDSLRARSPVLTDEITRS